MAKDVKFNIKLSIDGKEQIISATTSVKDLQNVVKGSQTSAEAAIKKFNEWGFALQGISSAVGNLQSVMSSLASGYQASLQANTQLTTVMRQRMDATSEDIAQVKEVVAAQKELGVVSGTVQIRGAQQMATFLGQKQSLMTLIPAMNNLIAQQKGVNATQEDAYGIANLMGKAMQGQTSALKRVGITFTEAQEKVMKMGNEQERAAMLAQIITDNVGNMNAELGKTDIGKQKQLEMQLASIKVKIGELAQTALPYVSLAAQSLQLVMSLRTLGVGITGVTTAIMNMTAVQRVCSAVSSVWGAVQVRLSALTQVLMANMTGAAVSATTLRLAIQGLMSATVIGAVLTALGMAISELITKMTSASQSAQEMASAEQQAANEIKQAYDSALKQTYSQLMSDYTKLQKQWNSLKTTHEKNEWIKRNKPAFDDLRLSINKISDAEDIFNKNTGKVQEAFERRAQAAGYAAQMSNLYGQQLQAQTRANDIKLSIQSARQAYYKRGNVDNDPYFYQTVNQKARDFAIREDKRNGNDGNIDAALAQLDRINEKIKDTKRSIVQLGNVGDLIRPGEVSSPKASSSPSSPKASSSHSSPSTPKTSTPKEDNSLQGQINALQKEINATKDAGLKDVLQSLLDMLVRQRSEIQQTAASAATNAGAQANGSTIQQSVVSSSLDMSNIKGVDTSNIQVGVNVKGTEDLERMQQAIASLSNIDLQSFSGVQQALQNINSISNPTAQGFAAAGAACSALGGALQQLGEDSAAAKAGMVIAAIGQLVLSFAQAMVSASGNWITWLAFGIAGTAQLISLIATISGFTTGGVVAGSQERGDKLMVGVNSGEMILNKAQQRRLFDIANGNISTPRVNTSPGRLDYAAISSVAMMAAASSQPQVVEFRIKGNILYGVLQNQKRISGKSYMI